jgi:hypothetical protein
MTNSLSRRSCVVLMLFIVVLLLSVTVFAQELPADSPENAPNSKFEAFAGYSYLNPPATLQGLKTEALKEGFDIALTINATRRLGFTVDIADQFGHGYPRKVLSGAFGPKLTFRGKRFNPFIEALGVSGSLKPEISGPQIGSVGVAAGGGLGVTLTDRFSWRVIQADYIYQNYCIPTKDLLPSIRVQSGLVLMFGAKPMLSAQTSSQPSSTCSVRPNSILAGEPVTASVISQGFNPKTVAYAWQTTGGTLTENGMTASVATIGLTPGSYSVKATIKDRKNIKKMTECTAGFVVKEPPIHPPSISCSANPSMVKSGDSVTIACELGNPDARTLSTNCHASSGKISGNETTFTLDTIGLLSEAVSIDCTIRDDRGLTASTSMKVDIQVPPPPPGAIKVAEILFSNRKRPARVDNVAKAILDDLALRLERDLDLKAVIIGDSKGNVALAQQRAVNTKWYLTKEKGIDPARIAVRTGPVHVNDAKLYAVPAAASFNHPEAARFDESKVKPQAERAHRRRHHVRRTKKVQRANGQTKLQGQNRR